MPRKHIFQLAAEGNNGTAIARELFRRDIPTPGEYKAARGNHTHDILVTQYFRKGLHIKVGEFNSSDGKGMTGVMEPHALKSPVTPSPKHYSFLTFATPVSLYLFRFFAA